MVSSRLSFTAFIKSHHDADLKLRLGAGDSASPHPPGEGERTIVMTDKDGRRFSCGVPPPSVNASTAENSGSKEEVSLLAKGVGLRA